MVSRLEFALRKQPIDVQLTVHINNLINTAGKSRIIVEFKRVLSGGASTNNNVNTIIDYYGVEDVKGFFLLVYGWEFDKRIVK